MEIRELFRKHLLTVFLVFIAIQVAIFAVFQNINHRPQASRDEIEISEGRETKISPLLNDTDKDDEDVLKISAISTPRHGSVKQKGNILIYQPIKGFTGKDSLNYTVTDGKKNSKPGILLVRVMKNQAPVAVNDNAVVYSGGSTIIYALDNDQDKEKDSMMINETTKPLHGEINVYENKIFYTNRNTAAIADSFFYIASDGRNNSRKAAVKVIIQKKTELGYPWLALDVGEVSKPGTISFSKQNLTIQAFGTDIWNNADGFYFVYQVMNGDCEISAKIESLEGPHEWTKSGLMIRENLSATSKNVFIGLTTKNGITTQARLNNFESSENGERKSNLKVPYWIKLSRVGDTFKFAISPDGIKWEEMEDGPVTMAVNVYVGIAVTSHDNQAKCKTVISNCKIKGNPFVFKKPSLQASI